MIRVLRDHEAASRAAAEEVVARAAEALETPGRFTVALAGGGTPRRLYELLGTEYRNRIPWDRVRILWGDERCVPPDDPRSNYRMARAALLGHVPIDPDAVHRIRAEYGAGRAADEYDRLLAGIDRLDLAILGAGADGHTASLFPGQMEPDDERWARGVAAPRGMRPRERVTLTLHALNAFSHALFLVTGTEKQAVVSAARRAMDHGIEPDAPPAARVRPGTEPLWIVDRAAAG
ncbi:MAG: 6-phosphogluconolactonase [Candidatus Longimicrobiales bacterium M2_2A_002]